MGISSCSIGTAMTPAAKPGIKAILPWLWFCFAVVTVCLIASIVALSLPAAAFSAAAVVVLGGLLAWAKRC
jgi:hypothetical protein